MKETSEILWSNSFPRSENWPHRREVTCSVRPQYQKRQSGSGRSSPTHSGSFSTLHSTPAALSIGHGSPEKHLHHPCQSTPPTEMSLEATFSVQLWALPSQSVAHSRYYLGLALIRQSLGGGERRICKCSSFLSHCLQVA